MHRIVLVTGASMGIGHAIAEKFLKNDDIVYVNYFTHKAEALALQEKYSNARAIYADIKSEEDIKEMINKIALDEGHLDILVNNAGIAKDSEVDSKTKESFSEILEVNLIGTFLVCKYAHKIMEKGSIINISSDTGIDAYYPYGLDYDASKAGVISLTHNLAVEYAPNIRINAVAPGWVNTAMNKELDKDFIKEECDKILLGRFAKATEIASVVYFLASDDASYINGSVIRIDGGKK